MSLSMRRSAMADMTPGRVKGVLRDLSHTPRHFHDGPVADRDVRDLCTTLEKAWKESKGWRERCEQAESDRRRARCDLEMIAAHFGIRRQDHNCHDSFVREILAACHEGARRAMEAQRNG